MKDFILGPLSQRVGTDPAANLNALAATSYIGRGLIIGINAAGTHGILVYLLTGRSPSSQNRLLIQQKGGLIVTDYAVKKDLGGNDALLLYNAMKEKSSEHGFYVVSNGSQTDTVCKRLTGDGYLDAALRKEKHEPDDPNFTPRITGMLDLAVTEDRIQMSSLRTIRHGGGQDRGYYSYDEYPEQGSGLCLVTYDGNAPSGQQIPAFRDAPFAVPLAGKTKDIAAAYWEVLSPDFRVSVAVKSVNLNTGESSSVVINRHQAAAA